MKRETQTKALAHKGTGPSQQRRSEQRAGGAESRGNGARGGSKGLRRLVPLGRHARRGAPTKSGGSGEDLRAQVGELRDRAAQGLAAQPVAMGLGALALGFGAAVLIPATRVERRAFVYATGAVRQLDAVMETARQLAETAPESEEGEEPEGRRKGRRA